MLYLSISSIVKESVDILSAFAKVLIKLALGVLIPDSYFALQIYAVFHEETYKSS